MRLREIRLLLWPLTTLTTPGEVKCTQEKVKSLQLKASLIMVHLDIITGLQSANNAAITIKLQSDRMNMEAEAVFKSMGELTLKSQAR